MYTVKTYFGDDPVTLTWVPSNTLPPRELITAVAGPCFWQGKLVLTKLDRGFDTPGGHIEPGESPEECMRREVLEEAYVRARRCTLLGYTIVDHSENPNWKPGGKYPKIGYLVFYRVDVEEVLPFKAEYESTERILVAPEEVAQYYPGWSSLEAHMLAAAILNAPLESRAKRLILVRHAKATGQEGEAPLTPEGREQAEQMAAFLQEASVDRIVASPWLRAVQTAQPLAERLGLPVEPDDRLVERVLSAEHYEDWMEKLKATYDDYDLVFEGGESNRAGQQRAVATVSDILAHGATNTLVVSHGNLITLLLHHFDPAYGFEQWKAMSNPDVFLVTVVDGKGAVERLWRCSGVGLIEEYAVVETLEDVPVQPDPHWTRVTLIPKGSRGAVVMVHTKPNLAYEVEFSDGNGETWALAALLPHQIKRCD